MHISGDFGPARHFLDLVANGNAFLSFSQFGEDRLIDVFFHNKVTPGIYVDVGAHHPERFSNTFLLHRKGWHGINIDGDPGNIELFTSARPNDINITAFLAERNKRVTFSKFSDTAVNTISDVTAIHYEKFWSVISRTEVETTTLASVLDDNLSENDEIDLLSIDVEGVDLQVLSGNDWSRYRPHLAVVEAEGLDISRAHDNEIVAFMTSKGYRLSGFIHVTAFFERL